MDNTISNRGTAPYQFSIDGGNTWQNDPYTYGPFSGSSWYWITVRAFDGCIDLDSVLVVDPPLLVIDSISINEVSCFNGNDGELTVHHSGGTPGFSYVWTTIPLQYTQTATGLSIGPYTVVVSDTNNCSASGNEIMTEPPQLSITSMDSTDALCFGDTTGTATVTATGGTLPYNYLWSNGDTTQTATGLSIGNYSVVITDANGCLDSANICKYMNIKK